MGFKPTLEQENIVKASLAENMLKVNSCAGSGKEQPVSSIVKTPFGDKTLGSIKTGDSVLGRNGKPTKVLGVFPQGVKPVYKVIFRDKSEVLCGLDHNWSVFKPSKAKTPKVMTTEQIISDLTYPDGRMKYQVPLCSPVEYTEKPLPLDPYFLGAFLGDGSFTNSTAFMSFHKNDKEIFEKMCNNILEDSGIDLVRGEDVQTSENGLQVALKVNGAGNSYNANPVTKILREMGMYKNKHVPEDYLLGSVEQRLEMLRGLMDTDGSIRNNRTSFCNTNDQIIDAVFNLVQSLGGTCIESSPDKRKKPYARHLNVKMFINPFSLPRKRDKWGFSSKNPPSRYIKDICYAGYSEEQVCIEVDAEDSLYLTDAFVVTHNTSTMKLMANAMPKASLYLAFNKAIADEASTEFPSHVACKTTHSLAFAKYGKKIVHKLNRPKGRYVNVAGTPAEIARYYDIKDYTMGGDTVSARPIASIVKHTVRVFEQSDAENITTQHVPFYMIAEVCEPRPNIDKRSLVEHVFKYAKKLWDDRCDTHSPVLATHDTYLKLFQLSKPKLNYDIIYVDEAQDSNGPVLDIVMRQTHAKVVFVGDSFQGIYAFRGAVNAMEQVECPTMYLTKSFRYGQAIADVATAIIKGAMEIEGFEQVESNVGPVDTSEPYTMLFRTNGCLLENAAALIEEGVEISCEIDTNDFKKLVQSGVALFKGDQKGVKHDSVVPYAEWDELVEASSDDPELKRLARIVTSNPDKFLTNLQYMKKKDEAHVTLTTAHKSKGRQWDQVVLGPDFPEVDAETGLKEQERNLLYVAATRAIKTLELNPTAMFLVEDYWG